MISYSGLAPRYLFDNKYSANKIIWHFLSYICLLKIRPDKDQA